MNKIYSTAVAGGSEPSAHVRKSFKVSYQHSDGSVLHASVKYVSEDDYEVFIEEKAVIIHCTKDEHGALTCRLNSHGNPLWIDGISKEVQRKIARL